MPRTETANQRIREEQREKILDAAGKVFAHKGRAATMADVAAEASISQGLAYRYFTNKEELFHEILLQAIQSSLTAPQHILQMPGTPGEQLTFLISSLIKGRREHPEFHQLFDQVLSDETMPNDLREPVLRQAQIFLDVLRQLIIEGQATKEVAEDDPDQLVEVVTACLEGLTRWASRNPAQFNKYVPDASIILRILKP